VGRQDKTRQRVSHWAKHFVINSFVPLKINKEIPVTLESEELALIQSIAALFRDSRSKD
jgi:hypothetical protein